MRARLPALPSRCLLAPAGSRPTQACHTTALAGTKPLPSALKNVATHFQRYPTVGALTGELTVQRPYRTFLTAVQFCEWKVCLRGGSATCRQGGANCRHTLAGLAARSCCRWLQLLAWIAREGGPECLTEWFPALAPFRAVQVSHLLQKPVESICGFLTVLPGAFCAFRWAAVEVRAGRGRPGRGRPAGRQQRNPPSAAGRENPCPARGCSLALAHPLPCPSPPLAGRAPAQVLLWPVQPGGAECL